MGSGSKVALFAGILVALAGAALLVLLFPPGSEEPVDWPPGPAREGEPGIPGDRATPPPDTAHPPEEKTAPPAEVETTPGQGEVPPVPAEPTHVLRGRLVTKGPLLPGVAEIEVIGAGEGEDRKAGGRADPDGAFEIDISAFFTGEGDVEEMEVLADHSAYMPAKKQVDAGSPTSGDATPVVYTAELPFVLAGIVTGKVLSDALTPVEGAVVAVTGKEKGSYRRRPFEAAETGKDGSFRLRAGADGEALLVAMHRGYAPAWAVLPVRVGEASSVDPLVLKPGLSIRGRVSLGGGEPAGRWAVVARVRNTRARLRVRRWAFGWIGETLVLSRARAVTDETGAYEIRGLSPVEYTLRPDEGGRDAGAFTHMSVYQRDELEKRAKPPASEVDFEVPCSRLRIRVVDGDRPVPEAWILILHEGGTSVNTDARGQTVICVRPGARFRIQVRHDGFENFLGETTGPPDGEEAEFVVRLRRQRRTLFFTVRSSEGEVPLKCTCALFEPGTKPTSIFFGRAAVKDGVFFVPNPGPGVLILRVRPGDDWRGGLSYWTEVEKQVEIPEEGEVRVVLETRRAGRVRVAARGPDGAFLEARCTVRNRTGSVVPVLFVARTRRSSSRSPRLHEKPSMVVPALAPGHYQLEFTLKGYYSKTVPAEVRAGEVTGVDVTLDPE